MAQWLAALAALQEDWDSIPCSHVAAHSLQPCCSSQPSVTRVQGIPVPSSSLQVHCMGVVLLHAAKTPFRTKENAYK